MESLADMWKLVQPPLSPSDVLDVCLLHLREARVPSKHTALQSDRVRLAFASISAMGKLQLDDENDSGMSLVERICESWSSVYKWVVFMFDSVSKTLPPKDVRRSFVFCDLIHLFHMVTYSDVIKSLLAQDLKAFEIVTRLWFDCEDVARAITMDGEFTHLAQFMFSAVLHGATAAQLDVVVSTAGSAELIAKRALSRLRRLLNPTDGGEPPTANIVSRYITIFADLRTSPAIQDALFTAGIVPSITAMVLKLAELERARRDGVDGVDYVDLLVYGIMYLRECFQDERGAESFVQAIRAGFVNALCGAIVLFARTPGADFTSFEDVLENVLSGLLVYRSVLAALYPAITKFSASPARREMERTPMFGYWQTFCSLVTKRSVLLKTMAAEQSHDRKIFKCGNNRVRGARNRVC